MPEDTRNVYEPAAFAQSLRAIHAQPGFDFDEDGRVILDRARVRPLCSIMMTVLGRGRCLALDRAASTVNEEATNSAA